MPAPRSVYQAEIKLCREALTAALSSLVHLRQGLPRMTGEESRNLLIAITGDDTHRRHDKLTAQRLAHHALDMKIGALQAAAEALA